MNNNKDRSHVRGADELQTMVDLLPSLRTGEAVKMPSRVQFYKLGNAPKGSDPDVAKCWQVEPGNDIASYEMLVNLRQNQKFRED